ncbi:unnamed protein product [Protopolystoma xenopodis]|uniref:Uncharacterized protein n=1 Tax=Protopolystoma xenopodis TaxID=117903 RepID=A0A3S5BS61_9PLAT|nr:unnamed protein product [Protopolystoma xenopodis]
MDSRSLLSVGSWKERERKSKKETNTSRTNARPLSIRYNSAAPCFALSRIDRPTLQSRLHLHILFPHQPQTDPLLPPSPAWTTVALGSGSPEAGESRRAGLREVDEPGDVPDLAGRFAVVGRAFSLSHPLGPSCPPGLKPSQP